jgi:signal recognition particle subunit SRP72
MQGGVVNEKAEEAPAITQPKAQGGGASSKKKKKGKR